MLCAVGRLSAQDGPPARCHQPHLLLLCTHPPPLHYTLLVASAGSMQPVPNEELEEAQELLFSRHPDMRTWPAGHSFRM